MFNCTQIKYHFFFTNTTHTHDYYTLNYKKMDIHGQNKQARGQKVVL